MPESSRHHLTPTTPSATLYGTLLWWVLRVFAVSAWAWTLWPYSVALAIVGPLALATLLFALRAPHDVPRVRPRASLPTVVAGDLLTTAAALTALWSLSPWLAPLVLVIAVVVALSAPWFRIRVWSDVRAAPRATTGTRALGATAAVLSLLLVSGLVGVLASPPIREALTCTTFRADRSPSPIHTTGPVTESATAEYLPGTPVWERRLQLDHEVGSSQRVVTVADYWLSPLNPYWEVTALAPEDGSVLWHLDATDVHRFRDDTVSSSGLHRSSHVGTNVLMEFGSGRSETTPLIAFDEMTGSVNWCLTGLSRVTAAGPDRFLARMGGDEGPLGLFDVADGARVTEFPDRPDPAPYRSGVRDDEVAVTSAAGRVSVWHGPSVSSYDAESGALLFHVADVRPEPADGGGRPRHRPVEGVLHAGDVTVVAFGAAAVAGPEAPDTENGTESLIAAYDLAGRELWNSAGEGPNEVGEPLVGTANTACGQAFDGLFLTKDPGSGEEANVYAVRVEDGTVAWMSSPHDDDHLYCDPNAVLIAARIQQLWGKTADADGPAGTEMPTSLGLDVTDLALGGDGLLLFDRNRLTYHALP